MSKTSVSRRATTRLPPAAVLLGSLSLGMLINPAANAAVTINFDTLNDGSLVNDYYNGGSASDGTTGGPNYGISFSNAYVLNEFTENEGLLITPPNSITFLSGTGSVLNDAAGFNTGFSFDYSAISSPGVVNVFSGLDGTGTLLASINLPLTPDGSGVAGCMGHNFCPDLPAGVAFDGTAESVNFSGTANQIVYDDITIGSASPITSAIPEPSTWAMMLLGFACLGLVAYRQSRKSTLQPLLAT